MQIQRDREIVVTLALLATGLAGCSGGGSGEGFVDASFNFPKTALDGDVLAIALAADGSGDVYVGGSFTSYDGTSANRLVRLRAAGTRDAGFLVGEGFDGDVVAITPATDGSGDVYVGGSFTTYDGTPANRIVRLDADGALDAAFHTGAGFDEAVEAIAAATDGSGDIYVSGGFYTYDGTSVPILVRLDADGTLDAAFQAAAEVLGQVAAIVPTTDGSGDVYVSGLILYGLASLSYGVMRLDADGTLDAAFDVGIGPNLETGGGQALALAADGSGDVYVGGYYMYASSPPTPEIARLDADGTLDAAFDVGTGFRGGGVRAIAAAADGSGDIYVGGDFASYNGTAANGVIAIHADGTIDTGFDVGTGFVGGVSTVAAATDGSRDAYVGGAFTSYDGKPSIHLVALDAEGSVDPASPSLPRPDSTVLRTPSRRPGMAPATSTSAATSRPTAGRHPTT